MSFSSKIKDELIKIEDMPECCVHAMAYGMLLFGRSFNLGGISLMTDHNGVADKYIEVAGRACGVRATKLVSEAGKITADFSSEEDRQKVLSCFSSTGNERILRIDRGNLSNEAYDGEESFNCCDAAFLRGAFLSCGTASDPNKSYHIEFVVPFKTLSMDLLKMLTDYGLKAKHMVRRYVNVIYIKDSESIEDLLTIMGASNSSMEIMNIKIYKDIRNLTNRRNNFENANLLRTADAAFDQVSAIEFLKEKGVFVTLSDDLKQVARLRVENEEASLREIGEMCVPPMSRSAVNHRLKRLIAVSDKLKEEGSNID
ncbi:MAG: DNA-binding protein WhiA [Clostridia bacterium]|nr:DNA-binding protein WhiA [Clostridia bacterium]